MLLRQTASATRISLPHSKYQVKYSNTTRAYIDLNAHHLTSDPYYNNCNRFTTSDIKISQLSAIPVDSQSIQIAWNPPTQRANLVSAYTLKYRPNTSSGEWKQTSINVNETQHLVTGLSPSEEYTFIVVTSSISGTTSEDSEIQTAKTLPQSQYYSFLLIPYIAVLQKLVRRMLEM